MLIALHKQVRATPRVRAQIAASDEPVAVPARRFGVTEPTICKWKRRPDVYDRPHTAHRLQTTLTPGQEAIMVYLRRALLPPLSAAALSLVFCCCTDVAVLKIGATEFRTL